jgi:hypothetical protein
MNTGPLNAKSFETIANALRSRLTGKTQDLSAPTPKATGLSADQSAVSSQDERYRAFANVPAPEAAPANKVMSSSWLSGRTLQNIIEAVKRHLGGSIPPGTTITIRPRPGGRPGEYTVSVRPGKASQGTTGAAPAPQPTPAPKPAPAGGTAPAGGSPVAGGGTASPASPTAGDVQRLLSEPLPALPGPAKGPDAQQNDLQNRAEAIKAIRQDPALQAALANWNALSNDVRLQAGQRMSAIMGKVYGFKPFDVEIDPSLRPPTQGYFSPGTNQLALSPSILSNPQEFVNTVTHEQAHAYQHEKARDASSGRLPASDPLYATARAWGQNFSNYATPDYNGYQAYRNQPIEAHAFATGNAISAGVFAR